MALRQAAPLTGCGKQQLCTDTNRDLRARGRAVRRPGCLRNSRCNRRGYDDLFRVTADVAGFLPGLQPATGAHPVPAPLAGELCRARGHTSIGLRAQPSDRLPVLEWACRNNFGYREMLLLEFGQQTTWTKGCSGAATSSSQPVPKRHGLSDDRGCWPYPKISSVERVRRLRVHEEDFAVGQDVTGRQRVETFVKQTKRPAR